MSSDSITYILNVKDRATGEYIPIPALKGNMDLSKLAMTTGMPSYNDGEALAALKQRYQDSTETGIDVIVDADYTVEGTPTITAAGVASGFSSSNYIEIPFEFSPTSTSTYVFSGKIKVTNPSDSQMIFAIAAAGADYLIFDLDVQSGEIRLRGAGLSEGINKAISANTAYAYEIKIRGGQITLKIDGEIVGSSNSFDYELSGDTIIIGNRPDLAMPFLGEVNLNFFRVYEYNGVSYDTVCAPCLKIPYKLAKTGSKMVDWEYRQQVEEAYRINGKALYYVIDTTNNLFKLPMGDIYGFIEQAKADAEATYADKSLSNLNVTGEAHFANPSLSNLSNTGNQKVTPIGTVIWFAATTAPSGYLICNGSAVSRTDYADLFAVIGTTFGTGDGSTTFNLPGLLERVAYGASITLGSGTVKTEIEDTSHGHTIQDAMGGSTTKHTDSESASHKHAIYGVGLLPCIKY